MVAQHNLARVLLAGQPVGALSYDGATGLCAFEYEPSWRRVGFALNPVHLPLSEQVFQFPALPRATYRGLPSAFADTLPDDFGNAVIDAWLAREGRDKASFTALERLLYNGKRGMGALEYAPSLERTTRQAQPLALDQLVAMAQAVLDQRANLAAQLDSAHKDALASMMQVGTSAGGARAKAVIGVNAARTEIRSGQVDLPEGFEHYLLKFDGVVEHANGRETYGDPQGYGRMEYAYYLMAKDAGIAMSPCELLEDGERAHFMTKRFDRIGNRKVHYQSLCAMDHADFKQPGQYSYEQLFALMRKLRLPKAQALEMYRRMVFNIVARNHDDHSKNTGFLFNPHDEVLEQARWQLSPAFDVAYSYKPGSPWVNAHQLSLNGKRDNFERADLLVVAQSFEKEAKLIIEQVKDTVVAWDGYAQQAGVFESFRREIGAAHRLTV